MITNKQKEAIYEALKAYFETLKNDGVLSKYAFNNADCEYLTGCLILAMNHVDMEENNSYEEQYLKNLEAGQESFEERKLNHDR